MAVCEDPKELSFNEVVKYLEQKGGRSTNQELVSQFRKFLNDPTRPVEARLQFKDIVNTVATVQEEEGVKYIALKKKYSSSSECSIDKSSSINSSPSQPVSPARYNSPYSQSYQPYWRYRLSCDRPLVQPKALPGSRRYSFDTDETHSLPVTQARSSPDLSDPRHSEEWSYSLPLEEPIYENTSSLIYQNKTVDNSKYMRQKAASTQELHHASQGNGQVSHQTSGKNNYFYDKSNSIDVQKESHHASHVPLVLCRSLPESDIHHQIRNREDQPKTGEILPSSNLFTETLPQIPFPCLKVRSEIPNTNNHFGIPKESETLKVISYQETDENETLNNSESEQKIEKMEQKASIKDYGLQSPSSTAPTAPPRKKDTTGKEIKKFVVEEKSAQECIRKESSSDVELQQLNLSTGSVMERVQKLDRLSTELIGKRSVGSPVIRSRKRENRNEKANEDDVIYVSLNPKIRKQWFIAAAKCDYHTLVALLKDHPKLAGIKDMASGFTALHWAAKHGNADVIKLVAGTHRVNPNIRSHSGYTSIHIATLYKHKTIVDLLIKTYGADATLRDHSGKRADQYPDGYISRIAGSNRPGQTPSKHVEVPVNKKRIYVRPLEKESSGTFIRIGSLNLKVARSSAMFGNVRSSARLKTWSSADSVSDFRLRNSFNRSFHLKKKKTKKSSDPPQRNSTAKHDSDSDSAYGFHP